MRKMHNAILFGARMTNHVLSSQYNVEMVQFLTSFKKESAEA